MLFFQGACHFLKRKKRLKPSHVRPQGKAGTKHLGEKYVYVLGHWKEVLEAEVSERDLGR